MKLTSHLDDASMCRVEPPDGQGAQLRQMALAGSAGAEAPAARTIPQIDNGELFGVSRSALLGAGFAERENKLQMAAPKTEGDVDPHGCPIRELGDTIPLLSKKAEQASATARGGSE